MSLLRPVLRACCVAALRDQTWAESRVFDSDMTPLGEAIKGQAHAPYIVVYTDGDDLKPMGRGEVYDGVGRNLSIIFEMGVASGIVDSNGNNTVQFAATDEGLELAVDILEDQIISSIWGDPKSPFGELVRKFIGRITRMPSRRGGSSGANTGIRYAARRLTLIVSPMYDVVPGVVLPPVHPIRTFIEYAAANPDLKLTAMATIISKMLTAVDAPTWRQAQAMLGQDTEGVRALHAPGTPLPSTNPIIEKPPIDGGDPDEYVPGLDTVHMDWDQPPL